MPCNEHASEKVGCFATKLGFENHSSSRSGALVSHGVAGAGSGAKVVLALELTACGAMKGTIDDVVLGNLTGL